MSRRAKKKYEERSHWTVNRGLRAFQKSAAEVGEICYICAMTKALKELFARAETWPQEVQDAAIESLRIIEDVHTGKYQLTKEDLEALERSADDVRHKRFASPKKMKAFFRRASA